jgi:hypothetical protein
VLPNTNEKYEVISNGLLNGSRERRQPVIQPPDLIARVERHPGLPERLQRFDCNYAVALLGKECGVTPCPGTYIHYSGGPHREQRLHRA